MTLPSPGPSLPVPGAPSAFQAGGGDPAARPGGDAQSQHTGESFERALVRRDRDAHGTFATIIPGVQNGKYQVGQDNFGATKAREQVVDFATYLNDGSADIGFITPRDRAHAAEIVAEVRAEQARAGRDDVRLFGDLVVLLDDSAATARARWQRLNERAGAEYSSDACAFSGTQAQLADLLLDWREAGLAGFRLRPAALPHDLIQVTDALVPQLRRRGAFRDGYPAGGWPATLRGLLGLPRPVNRYRRGVA